MLINFLSTTLILSALERKSKSDFFYLFFFVGGGGGAGGTDTNTVCQTVSNEVKYKKATIYKM